MRSLEKNALHQLQPVNYFSLAELYHENTKYDRLASVPDFIKIAALRRNPKVWYTLSQSYKNYPGVPRLPLPSGEDAATSFAAVVKQRRSQRDFASVPMPREKLGRILHCTYGLNGQFTYDFDAELVQHLRMVPSGGALYPLEIYLFVNRVEGTSPGLYHYNVLEHCLELLHEEDFSAQLPGWFCDQSFVGEAAVVLLFTGIFERTKIKYGERGYRFVLIEAGHAAQNTCLSSANCDVACAALGGFYEREIEAVMQIDGVKESLLYALALGEINIKKSGAMVDGAEGPGGRSLA
jgi:SagB-type dehydrogenase family enzyme